MAKVMSEQEYLYSKGVGDRLSGFMDDKMRSNRTIRTQRGQDRFQRQASKSINSYYSRRAQARGEYRRLVSTGKLRAPTEMEKMKRIAKGNSENRSVQAAKRVLAKMRARQQVSKSRSGHSGG